MIPVTTAQPQPEFKPPTVDPEPATEEEIDEFAEENMAMYEEILAPKKPVAPAIPKKAPLPTFGPSKAKVEPAPGVAHHIEDMVGPKATAQDMASVSGAPEGSTVEVYGSESAIEMETHDKRFRSRRGIVKDEHGKPYLFAGSIDVKPEYQGQGLGREIFGRMVENASKLDLDRIETYAARGKTAIGYYVWPLFGYDGPIHRVEISKIKEAVNAGELPKSLKDVTRISQLYATQQGIDWWKKNGDSINLTFDLKPNSYSRQTWEAYLRRKTQE